MVVWLFHGCFHYTGTCCMGPKGWQKTLHGVNGSTVKGRVKTTPLLGYAQNEAAQFLLSFPCPTHLALNQLREFGCERKIFIFNSVFSDTSLRTSHVMPCSHVRHWVSQLLVTSLQAARTYTKPLQLGAGIFPEDDLLKATSLQKCFFFSVHHRSPDIFWLPQLYKAGCTLLQAVHGPISFSQNTLYPKRCIHWHSFLEKYNI